MQMWLFSLLKKKKKSKKETHIKTFKVSETMTWKVNIHQGTLLETARDMTKWSCKNSMLGSFYIFVFTKIASNASQ